MTNFRTDGPAKIDKFGFAAHARGLAERIVSKIAHTSESDESGFVIALQGAWGTGKSTFLNLLRENLEAADTTKVAVVDFDAWWLSSGTSPTLPFLERFSLHCPRVRAPLWLVP